jgi:hypothetical protein
VIAAFTMIAFLEARKAGLIRRGEIGRNVVAVLANITVEYGIAVIIWSPGARAGARR